MPLTPQGVGRATAKATSGLEQGPFGLCEGSRARSPLRREQNTAVSSLKEKLPGKTC